MSKDGTVCWTELNTWNAERAKSYYGAVMGWSFEQVPTAGTEDQRPYYIATKHGKPVAGIFSLVRPDFEGVSDHWFTYLAVDDLQRALALSSGNGGKVCRPPFDIPGFGRLAIVSDCNGAVMGFLQPSEEAP